MSCNCPDTNKCPTNDLCLCGIDLNIYNPLGVLVETIEGNITDGGASPAFVTLGSTAFNSVLPLNYVLKINYNSGLGRWEMSYFNSTLNINILLGVLYSEDSNCPISNCWDLDCNAVAFNVLNVYDSYFPWLGEYTNGKKSYTFTSDWSGSDVDYRIYWTSDSSTIPGSGAPANTPAWILEEEVSPGVWSSTGYLFNSNKCPYGTYKVQFGGLDTRFSFTDLGVTGYDMKTSGIDCGCCDEEISINLIFDGIYYEDIEGVVTKDEYGNILGFNGRQYYTFEVPLAPIFATFFLYFDGSSWVMSDSLDGEGEIYAELNQSGYCPFGPYQLPKSPANVTLFSVTGVECFDCCDYYVPRNRNLLKKKKAIFVEEISAIRNQEIFGLKCGGSWDDLFRKHLIFDVLNCLPYGVLCEEEEQCLINNLNENCNC
jgi:hypothetical protein